ncbi:MAG: hypothetical protein A3A73_03175 [Omnitrophica bacterium RIFCSPLOWO2_01_FULL_50_24]|nr:MAG: hypothetical protein A3A73_03175 [Omnitrophica bacterium RIFCSPLOWO2_01_FULL_50_24]
MSRKSELASQIGQKIRDLRRRKNVTLIELSKITGIAQATLSRMETGLMVGTIKSHQQIAETLGVTLAELYEGLDSRQSKAQYLTAKTPKKITAKSDQYRCELLTQEIQKKKMTPCLITLNHNGKSHKEQMDRGVEKFLFVLEGTVHVRFTDAEYTLKPYETLYFDASIPHQLLNTSGKQAKVFCSVSLP